jgi:hypothetical protein
MEHEHVDERAVGLVLEAGEVGQQPFARDVVGEEGVAGQLRSADEVEQRHRGVGLQHGQWMAWEYPQDCSHRPR